MLGRAEAVHLLTSRQLGVGIRRWTDIGIPEELFFSQRSTERENLPELEQGGATAIKPWPTRDSFRP